MTVTQQIEELARAYAQSRSAESKAKNRAAFVAQEERSLEILDQIRILQGKPVA